MSSVTSLPFQSVVLKGADCLQLLHFLSLSLAARTLAYKAPAFSCNGMVDDRVLLKGRTTKVPHLLHFSGQTRPCNPGDVLFPLNSTLFPHLLHPATEAQSRPRQPSWHPALILHSAKAQETGQSLLPELSASGLGCLCTLLCELLAGS